MTQRAASAHPAPGEARGLARGFAVLAGLTFCLIMVGALVRAHDAGLACPDWPLCKGELVPAFDFKVAYEWGHRVFAGSISLGLVALSLFVWRRPDLRSPMRRRLILVFGLLGTQVVFGGLTVLLKLAPWTVSGHLLLGNAFCLTLVWISRDLAERFGAGRAAAELGARVPLLAAIVACCLALQILLGGLVSSYYAGLACTTFPTCNGESLVPSLEGLVGLHVVHRLNGFLLFASFGALAFATRRRGRVGMLAWLGLRLVVVQIFLGAMNVMLRLPEALTALHTGIAAAIVLTAGLIVRDVAAARVAERAGEPARAGRARVASPARARGVGGVSGVREKLGELG